MTDLSFTPTFRHLNWIDNVDRIRAGGPNGFNVRFDAIAADLHRMATVVQQIDAALALPVNDATGNQHLTPGLDFRPLPFEDSFWDYDQNGVLLGPLGNAGEAVMDLAVPDGIHLQSFRATGKFFVPFKLTLFRVPLLNAGAKPDKLAEISDTTPGIADPFDVTVPVDTALATVDTDTFRYYVLAARSGSADESGNTIAMVQLAYTS
ncbi:hypothetical protein [Amycolatopsis sp. NPDC021455]|uniref:hypothetical protein n=1 Tax=Amycolatopsis sp. NPDC021455 TaxID=3154901 RepID=UPI0033CFAC08